MASSQHAIRLVRRSVASTPALVRLITTTPSRHYSESSGSGLPAAPFSSENKPFYSSQVTPPTNPDPKTPKTPASSSFKGRPSALTPLVAPIVHADETPQFKYPPPGHSALPSIQSSFDPALLSPTDGPASTAGKTIDWGTSYHGLSIEPFSQEVQTILQAPIPDNDVEVKPDGIVYLPEIKYRRILNAAFGAGGWGLASRGDLQVGEKFVTREFALVVGGRFVAQARGECGYFGDDNVPNAIEGCKSNALTRCCKDLGIASELWDPRFIRKFNKAYIKQVDVYYGVGLNVRKKRIYMRKDDDVVPPYRLTESARPGAAASSATSSYKPYGANATKSASTAPRSTTTAARPATTGTRTTTTASKPTTTTTKHE